VSGEHDGEEYARYRCVKPDLGHERIRASDGPWRPDQRVRTSETAHERPVAEFWNPTPARYILVSEYGGSILGE
jgi:hypothetical protein